MYQLRYLSSRNQEMYEFFASFDAAMRRVYELHEIGSFLEFKYCPPSGNSKPIPSYKAEGSSVYSSL